MNSLIGSPAAATAGSPKRVRRRKRVLRLAGSHGQQSRGFRLPGGRVRLLSSSRRMFCSERTFLTVKCRTAASWRPCWSKIPKL